VAHKLHHPKGSRGAMRLPLLRLVAPHIPSQYIE